MTRFFILMLFLVSGLTDMSAQDDWTLEKDQNGIKVYTKKSDTNLKDSKAIVEINAGMSKVLNLLLDFEGHHRWMDRIKISRLLKKDADTVFYVYYEAFAPWPVANRDVVAKYRIIKHDDGRVVLESVSTPDYVPEKEGIVRVPESVSSWEIIPIGDNKVQVIFTNHSDPGGSIPDWLANMTATDNPYNTLLKLKETLEN